jgi:hypothetical protein
MATWVIPLAVLVTVMLFAMVVVNLVNGYLGGCVSSLLVFRRNADRVRTGIDLIQLRRRYSDCGEAHRPEIVRRGGSRKRRLVPSTPAMCSVALADITPDESEASRISVETLLKDLDVDSLRAWVFELLAAGTTPAAVLATARER